MRAPRFALGALLPLLGLAAAGPASAQVPWGDPGPGREGSRGQDLVVKLVTFGPGDDVTEWFGHTALVVEDRRWRTSRLYNYGEFSFDDTMLVRYAMGHLEFQVGERPVDRSLDTYAAQNRSIRVQELVLDDAQKLSLARALADNALPANRLYLYDHFTDNCATKPRDVLDAALGGKLAAQARPGRMTLRDHTIRHTATSPGLALLIDFLLNDHVDQPVTSWEEAFLPAELEAQVAAAVVDGRPLVASSAVIFEAARPPTPATPPAWGPWLLALGVVLGGALVALRRRTRALGLLTAVVGLLLGVPGSILFLMATMTDHAVTRWNENLLLANPLSLALLPLGLVVALAERPASRRLLRVVVVVLGGLGAAALLAKLLPAFDQDNARILALVVPILVGLVVAQRGTPS